MKQLKPGQSHQRKLVQNLVEDSPLRQVDPRAKLVISLCASLAVMLPLNRIAIFLLGYMILVIWAKVFPGVIKQIWRVRWMLLVLFLLDSWLIGLEFALTITLRIAILTGVFALIFSTTTSREIGLAFEALHLPYRYAFGLGLSLSSLSLLEEEWHAIREAQAARGVQILRKDVRTLWKQASELVAFTIPAIVMTTRRAWNATEAAYARGFDSPHRYPYYTLHFSKWDYILMMICVVVIMILFIV